MKIDNEKLGNILKDAENQAKQGINKAKEKIENIDSDEVKQKAEESLNIAKDAVKNKQINNKVIMAGIALLICIFVGISGLFGGSTLLATPRSAADFFDNYSHRHDKMSLENRIKKFEGTKIAYDSVIGRGRQNFLTDGKVSLTINDFTEWHRVTFHFMFSKSEIKSVNARIKEGKRICIVGKGKVRSAITTDEHKMVHATIIVDDASFEEVSFDKKIDDLEDKLAGR